ncbi:hypothetical protein [Hymenobacter telluris]|uniref:hypothetical protein n=1 Tax=Hymenobacter telluris TaxID=2816474 RepID=UPI0027D9E05A|nr:hypothetical protein [Hymenobacter telluris]
MSAITFIQYPKMDKGIRYYIRDNYFSRLNQIRFFTDDYIVKKKYKEINYSGEFQTEICHILPFAYWHHLNGTLAKTISCKGTKEFYFFSENHEERYDFRNARFAYENFDTPNTTHSISKSYQKWAPVPLKEHYKNDIFVFEKPIMVIANKYNVEWDGPPLNFLSIEVLNEIISKYKSKYQIIYNRPLPAHIVEDNSEILDLGEHKWLNEFHPEVILLDDLYRKHQASVNNFNHLQLMVYANCQRFVSVHGGTATLASYFGGVNIILSKGNDNPATGGGLEIMFNEFANFFPLLSGAQILHAKNDNDIINFLSTHY